MEDKQKVKVSKLALTKTAEAAMLAFAKKFVAVYSPIIDLVLKKNADYGDAWQRYDIYTPLIRLNDKLLRVEKLTSGQKALVADESVEDTLVDIVGYGLLALLKLHYDKTPNVEVSAAEQRILNLPDVEEDAYEPTAEDLDWLASQDN